MYQANMHVCIYIYYAFTHVLFKLPPHLCLWGTVLTLIPESNYVIGGAQVSAQSQIHTLNVDMRGIDSVIEHRMHDFIGI